MAFLLPGFPKVKGDSPLTREGTRQDHGQPAEEARSSACILEKLSEDERGSFVPVVHYFSEGLADT